MFTKNFEDFALSPDIKELYYYNTFIVFTKLLFCTDIIHGKLFQNNRFLEIDFAQGRDIPPGYTSKIAQTLTQWVESCDAISNCIDMQITRANSEKARGLKNKDHIEQEVSVRAHAKTFLFHEIINKSFYLP